MADPLYELLIPYFDAQHASPHPAIDAEDPLAYPYLSRLSTLTLSALTNTEPQQLSQSSQSTLRSLQALAKRSYRSIISSSAKLDGLGDQLPTITAESRKIEDALQPVEDAANLFAQKYSKTVDNPILERRKNALLLSRNVDRVADVLDLPTLLSSTISSSASSAANPAAGTGAPATGASSISANLNYASALDLHAHIKRLHTTYPNLNLVKSIAAQAEQEMKAMTSSLIASLQTSQGLKLAGAMRTIGWLRRVAPELDDAHGYSTSGSKIGQKGASLAASGEGSLGALFLVCRLINLETMLEALDPLKELALQETARRKVKTPAAAKKGADWAGGQQTERYLKRWIEIFREQSFAIMSMYRSIFPSALPMPGSAAEDDVSLGVSEVLATDGSDLQMLPSPLATFPMHLVEMLMETLRQFLPNVQDKTSRESLLTQVLYCAGSLGRLGADFGAVLALLLEELAEGEEEGEEGVNGGYDEWAEVVKKHRVQASRLELLASGVGGGRAGSIASRGATAAAS